MKDKCMNHAHGAFLAVLVAGFILVALAIFYAPSPEINISGTGGVSEKNTISVVGNAELEVDPDVVELYIRVKTEMPTAKTAQEENARIMSAVMKALKGEGIDSDEMETLNYNLWPQQNWDPDTREYVDDGYVVQHLLKITTDRITEAGDLLDVAVANGANGLDRVEFVLSDSKREDVNSEALAQAAKNAREKGDAIAQSVGVRILGINRVSESNVGYNSYPVPMYGMAESAVMDSRSFKTELSPESVTVSASIGILYEIE